MTRLALILLCCVMSGLARAEVYTYTDAQGNQVFTDQPRKNAKRVPLPTSNNLNQAAPATVKRSPAVAVTPKPVKVITHYDMLRILAPEPDGTVNQSSGELVVTVTSDPELSEGDQYQILLDGNPVGAPGTSPVFLIKAVDRGLHQLAAQIIDRDGETVERTPAQKLNMQRISLAQKRRNDPCTEEDYGVRPECPESARPCAKDDYGVRPQCPLSMKP